MLSHERSLPMFSNLTPATLSLIGFAVGLSFLLTAVARLVAKRIGMLDRPDGSRKSHKNPTPLLGGVALYVSLLVTVLLARWIDPGLVADNAQTRTLVLMLLVSGGLFCLVGLYDDRRSIRPRTKLLLQIAASVPFVLGGRSIESVHLLGLGIDLGLFGIFFTIFWLVACTNVINLADGLDGLAGTIGLIVCLAIVVHCEMQGLPGAMMPALIFSGCLLGFLLHNWPPAKIFLGDSGSLLIGFMLGALSIESSLKTATSFALAVPLVLVSVPIFDTLMAIVRRKLSGKGIGEADRGHIHHLLQDRGLSRAQSLLAISAMCFAMAVVTLVSAYYQNDLLALGFCVCLLVLLIIGRVFGYHETLLFFRYVQTMSLILVDTSKVLRTRLVLARMNQGESERSLDNWDEVTHHVRNMGGFQLEFVSWNERTDEVISRLHWTNRKPSVGGNEPSIDEFKPSVDGLKPSNDEFKPSNDGLKLSADGGQPLTDEPIWKFSYSVRSDAEVRATLIASGHSRKKLKGQRLVDLFRVFDTFCQSWSGMTVETPDAGPSDVITMPASPPRIVPATPDERPLDNRRVA
jgi:UDP-GlcNAc:undecaprenyl-phosphate GlcNAc-1-phosphate transferase